MFENGQRDRKLGRIESDKEQVIERIVRLKQQRVRLLEEIRKIKENWWMASQPKSFSKESKIFQEYGIQKHINLMLKQRKELRRKKQNHQREMVELQQVYLRNKTKIQVLKQNLIQKANQFTFQLP